MTQLELKEKVLSVLNQYTEKTIPVIQNILDKIPSQAKSLNFDIFPSQESDGSFDIRASLDGPDLYVLNKSIEDVADIFEVKFTANGFEPAVPDVDQGEVDFDINDTLCLASMEWLKSIWENNFSSTKIKTCINSADDFTQLKPMWLN